MGSFSYLQAREDKEGSDSAIKMRLQGQAKSHSIQESMALESAQSM